MHPGSSVAGIGRPRLERVLDVVRQLGAGGDLDETLSRIVEGVVDVVQFDAAAINVRNDAGDVLRVAAVAGPRELEQLRGQDSPVRYFVDLLDASEQWGALRFYSHERDQTTAERVARWTPPGAAAAQPGAWHPGDELMAPLHDRDGTLIGVLSVDQPRSGRLPDVEQRTVLELFAAQAAIAIADAVARRESESRRREAERRWQLAFEQNPVGSGTVDQNGRITQVNDAVVKLLGYSRDELIGRTIDEITYPDDVDKNAVELRELLAGKRDSVEVERRYVHRDGHVVWVRAHSGVVRDEQGAVITILGQLEDIGARKQAEEQIAHRATHDPLTDLPNRVRLEEVLAECIASGQPAGVLSCGIDRIKTVNDSLGHDAGDELIRAVASRLRQTLPTGVTVGRIGGDEFVVVVPGEGDSDALGGIASSVVAALRDPIPLRGYRHTVTMSIGVTASCPRQHAHPDEVMRDAYQALRRAKRRGRARVEFYDPTQDHPATIVDLELEDALRSALDAGSGLVPYFQPIVSLDTNVPVGYEALIRWQHPERGLLDPAEFLPIAEQTGLIAPIGWRMLELGCQAAADRRLTGGWTRWVAVNASGSQLGRSQLAPAVRSALEAANLPPERLCMEITETALVDASPAAIKELRELADMGVRLALDDFGTGYSSLSLLRDLPVSTVKIDRSFIKPIESDRNARAIVRSVIGLCREMGVTTVGEGIETEEQITSLRALGATLAQGYLLGRPNPLT